MLTQNTTKLKTFSPYVVSDTPSNTRSQSVSPKVTSPLPEPSICPIPLTIHKVEREPVDPNISLDSKLVIFFNITNRPKIEKLFQHFLIKHKQFAQLENFWKFIEDLSPLFIRKIENNEVFNFSDLHTLTLRDFFAAFLTLDRSYLTLSLVEAPRTFSPPWLFPTYVATRDPFYALNFVIAKSVWANRKITVRDKLGAYKIFDLATTPCDEDFPTISPEILSLELWQKQFDAWKIEWDESWIPEDPHYSIAHKRAQAVHFYKLHRDEAPHMRTTQSWYRAKGADDVLINPYVAKFYKFKPGIHLFPLDYKAGHSIDFLTRSSIKDALTLNPPYDKKLLTLIIVKLVIMATNLRRVYAVLVPFAELESWFILCVEMSYPILKFTKKLAFQRGVDLAYRHIAPFESCWILIGATSEQRVFDIPSNFLGFPDNWEYTKIFKEISFPRNVLASYPVIPGKGLNVRLGILRAFYNVAEAHNKKHTPPDLTQHFDFTEIKKFNFLLQNVDNDGIDLSSITHSFILNPFLKSKSVWEPITVPRKIFTYPKLKKYLEEFTHRPADKFLNKQCNICHRMNHTVAFCPQRCPTSEELGLTDRLEIHLYEFLETLDYDIYQTSHKNLWDNLNIFNCLLENWLKIQAQFWSNFRIYLAKRKISDFSRLLRDFEFSKGRKALGFNYATGAQRAELVLDAFGALLDLVSPPKPCEFVQSTYNGTHTYPEISPAMSEEDLASLHKRTAYIVPKKHITYILPRFSVTNSDRTTRTINNCTLLGPFTIKNKYRLPGKGALRPTRPGELMLGIDGKSAYNQRKLCWGDRNKIGFRTKISNRECYITMVTLPFGLHNAGYIYQMSLFRKLKRISGRLFILEYIDDVMVSVGFQKDGYPISEWKASAFLYLTTMIGEIFNNKFNIFSNKITMLGVHYYPETDRFTPKLSTFYKLGTKFAQIMKTGYFSLSSLESILGSCIWLLPPGEHHILQPFQYALTQAQKRLKGITQFPSKRHKTKWSEKTPCHRVTKLFLDSILITMSEITKQYLLVDLPTKEKMGNTLFIVVDSNPLVAGGYLFYRGHTHAFQKLKHLNFFRKNISNLTEKFITEHKLEKIFHSFRSEGVGLLAFLKQSKQTITQFLHKIQVICVLMDNQGLVTKLEKGNAHKTVDFQIHQEIFQILKKFKKPFFFRWLARDAPQLEIADTIGRDTFKCSTILTRTTLNYINKFFGTETFRPTIFNFYRDFSFLMPDILFDFDIPQGQTPMLVFSPYVRLRHLIRSLTCLAQLRISIIVGFPVLRHDLPERFCESVSNRLNFTNSSTLFQHVPQRRFKPSNTSYCFAILKKEISLNLLSLPS
jgi:hypothetical protein